MRHQRYHPHFPFVEAPIDFDKHTTDRDTLQYCLGGMLYLSATRNFRTALLNDTIPGLTSMVLCFDQAIDERKVAGAEENVLDFLRFVLRATADGRLSGDRVPLIFLRVRSPAQFDAILAKLDRQTLDVLTGFAFPHFASQSGEVYFTRLRALTEETGLVLYGMPILEGGEIARAESRLRELTRIRTVLDAYRDLVLNIRVGGADFSSQFGVRRTMDYTIYDVMPVRDCLMDIVNVFGRKDGYVISAPAWEYFLADQNAGTSIFSESRFQHKLLTRTPIVNDALDGLLREIILDQANGFVGKTCVHPAHIPLVNAMMAVPRDEYNDAVQILHTSGGVVKSAKNNKMNEIGPHTNWARQVEKRAMAYGVIDNENQYLQLFSPALMKEEG